MFIRLDHGHIEIIKRYDNKIILSFVESLENPLFFAFNSQEATVIGKELVKLASNVEEENKKSLAKEKVERLRAIHEDLIRMYDAEPSDGFNIERELDDASDELQEAIDKLEDKYGL